MGNAAGNLGTPFLHPRKGVSDETSNMSKKTKCLADSDKHACVRDKKKHQIGVPAEKKIMDVAKFEREVSI